MPKIQKVLMQPDLGTYPSIPAFIYGITREIWEDRGMGSKLDRYYAPNIKLRAPTGFTNSNQGVLGQTLQTLYQFPDRQLVGEDVIWKQFDDGTFISSHRLVSVMTHTGSGQHGQAQGRQVRSRIIADCWVSKQVVIEEWLARDQAAFAHCMGTTAHDMAQSMVSQERAQTGKVSYFLPEHDQPSACKLGIDKDADVSRYCQGMQQIWDGKDTRAIREIYFHGAALHTPGGQTRHGHTDIDNFVMGYLASFPDAKLTIHTAFANREPEQPVRLAIRWSLSGTHSGYGHFGAPTGAPIYIMGLTHAHMSQGKLMQEWMAVDEVAIWKQILAHQVPA